jgi:hypothetical protein
LIANQLQIVSFYVPASAAEPMEVAVPHSGLRMILVNRESVGLLGDRWKQLGIYFLLGPNIEDPDRFRAYVGEVGKSTLVQRVKHHAIAKDWWSRALLIASSSDDFNSAEIGWLEGRLYDVLHNALACDVMNGNRPGDASLSPNERALLERYVEPIMAALRACGAPPDTHDQKPPPKGKKPKRYAETLRDLIDGELLKPGTLLQPLKQNLVTQAEVLPDGQLEIAGSVYSSLSGAAKAVSGNVAEAGWDFWGAPSGDGGFVPLAKLRERLREAPVAKAAAKTTVRDLLDRGLLRSGVVLVPARNSVAGTATVGTEGEIVFNGVAHKTPSGAAKAASGQQAEAGWDFWLVRDEGASLADLRRRLKALDRSQSAKPEKLVASIGNGRQGYYSVEGDGERLVWRFGRGEAIDEHEVTPASEDWVRFWEALDRAGIWRWKENYVTEGVSDGTHWHLAAEHEGKNVESSGDNGYPESPGPDPSKAFTTFCRAVSTLSGREFA